MKGSLAGVALPILLVSGIQAQDLVRVATTLDDSTRTRVRGALATCERRWEARQGKAYEFTITGRASIVDRWEARYLVDAEGRSTQTHFSGINSGFPWERAVKERDPALTMTILFSRARAAIGQDELAFRCNAKLGFLDTLSIHSSALEDLGWTVGVKEMTVKKP